MLNSRGPLINKKAIGCNGGSQKLYTWLLKNFEPFGIWAGVADVSGIDPEVAKLLPPTVQFYWNLMLVIYVVSGRVSARFWYGSSTEYARQFHAAPVNF